jgi:two-component system nitrogen regulation response regulator NtrX
LRERREDIVTLANYFLTQLASAYGRRPKQLSPAAVAILENYHWPGNVRELRNIIERVMIMSDAETISSEQVQQALPMLATPGAPSASLLPETPSALTDTNDDLSLRDRVEDFERHLLQRVFQEVKGNVSEMARRLRTDRANLHRKLQRYNIK